MKEKHKKAVIKIWENQIKRQEVGYIEKIKLLKLGATAQN